MRPHRLARYYYGDIHRSFPLWVARVGHRAIRTTAWEERSLGCQIDAGELSMKLSARNQLKGTIVDVTKGATTSHVRIDIGLSIIVTSSITHEAVPSLG